MEQGSGNISRFTPAPKARSCIVCRSRKVRCDKLNPCSNCRKANIDCVFPANDRPPKWARRLERIAKEAESNASPKEIEDTQNVDQVMQRLRSLEGLVKELSGQLERATSGSPSINETHSGIDSASSPRYVQDRSSTPGSVSVQDHFGRLVVQNNDQSRYISSGFWSRMNDELDGLKMATEGVAVEDSDSSDDESLSQTAITQEFTRTPLERHSFFFRNNANSNLDLKEFHPLPSQIPFLLETYTENVNFVIGMLHMPTIKKIAKDLRGADMIGLKPSEEALIFSVYYAAVTSMEDEDVINNFGTTKSELNLKFRLGLEHALAKADFMNAPDLTLAQAFANFLLLARRYDRPRFIWMMTGLLIRMGQALGLQRDGSNFDGLTIYEIEMRRRLWWVICLLDVRASEDQGTEITITRESFDTKLPNNFSDSDIGPDKNMVPEIRDDITEITAALTSYQLCELVRKMVAPGGKEGIPDLEVQSSLIDKLYEKVDQGFLRLAKDSNQSAYWMACTCSLLVMSKMRLLVYLPVLFTSTSDKISEEIRDKLLVSAIEVAEWNHELNAEDSVRQWRWIYQTYTHWYAIVYMLIEVARRPLLPIVERAWVALQSVWMIPKQSKLDRNDRHWIPLRQLIAKARKHRGREIIRLREDMHAAYRLEVQHNSIPTPSSSGPFSENSAERFLQHWWELISSPKIHPTKSSQHIANSNSKDAPMDQNHALNPTGFLTTTDKSLSATDNLIDIQISKRLTDSASFALPVDWAAEQANSSSASSPWLWNDSDLSLEDINMDWDKDINWQIWLDAAKDLA